MLLPLGGDEQVRNLVLEVKVLQAELLPQSLQTRSPPLHRSEGIHLQLSVLRREMRQASRDEMHLLTRRRQPTTTTVISSSFVPQQQRAPFHTLHVVPPPSIIVVVLDHVVRFRHDGFLGSGDLCLSDGDKHSAALSHHLHARTVVLPPVPRFLYELYRGRVSPARWFRQQTRRVGGCSLEGGGGEGQATDVRGAGEGRLGGGVAGVANPSVVPNAVTWPRSPIESVGGWFRV